MKIKYNITRYLRAFQALLLCLVFVGCTDDVDEQEREVQVCVRAVWQDGLNGVKATRALTATDILADGTSDIAIATDDYPSTINVHCSDYQDFVLTKGGDFCTVHDEFWSYTPSRIYKDIEITHQNLTFTFSATIDDGDELEGTADKDNIAGNHLQVTLHHTKALLRFAFKVDEKYDKVRQILITDINLQNTAPEHDQEIPLTLAKKILVKKNVTYIAYAYVDPTVITTTTPFSIKCTYDIYDKDAEFPTGVVATADITANATHLIRKDVIAKNTFALGSLKDSKDANVSTIQAGYYYDLRVTLNPDYLYVLSEHDNKHIAIN